MIARIWEGKTKIEYSEIYRKIIIERDIPEYKKTKGFVKLIFLKQVNKEFMHFKLITFWHDLEAIKNFTGANFKDAVAYETDEKYLIDFPGIVSHFEVFAE